MFSTRDSYQGTRHLLSLSLILAIFPGWFVASRSAARVASTVQDANQSPNVLLYLMFLQPLL